jgi:hypothetical protein
MVLYVVYRASKESQDRSLISTRLKELGCKRIRRSFWEIKEGNSNKVLQVLKNNQPILLRRIRNLVKPSNSGNEVAEIGSLVVVAYSLTRQTRRERIKNTLKKAPCIRLARSVYAFSHYHHLFDLKNELVDAARFEAFISEIHDEVKVIPKLVIVNTKVNDRLVEEVKLRIQKETDSIIASCKELYQRVLEGETNLQKIQKSLSVKKSRYRALKKVANFYRRWLKIDMTPSLMKAYRSIAKVNLLLKGIHTPVMMDGSDLKK